MGLLSALAWRSRPHDYAGVLHPGESVIVLSMSAEKTRYVFYTYAAALTGETPTDRFMGIHEPDLSLTAIEAAAQIRSLIHTQLARTSIETRAAVEKFLKNPPRDQPMARSSTPKRGPSPHVYLDAERRSCIVLSREGGRAVLLRMRLPPATVGSIELATMSDKDFSQRYAPQDAYPPEKAALIYVAMAAHVGATEEALDAMAKLTTVTRTDRERARQRHRAMNGHEQIAATRQEELVIEMTAATRDAPLRKRPAPRVAASKTVKVPTGEAAIAKKIAEYHKRNRIFTGKE